MDSFSEFRLNGKAYFVCTKISDDTIHLNLIDENVDSWQGQDSLARLLKPLKGMESEKYNSLLSAALEKQDAQRDKFGYDLREKNGQLILVVTFRVKTKGLGTEAPPLLKAATFVLSKVDNQKEFLRSFLLSVAMQNAELRAKNEKLYKVAVQRDEYQKLAAEATEIKLQMELDYLQKFVFVLNEKKAKIRQLVDKLADHGISMDDVIPRGLGAVMSSSQSSPRTSQQPPSQAKAAYQVPAPPAAAAAASSSSSSSSSGSAGVPGQPGGSQDGPPPNKVQRVQRFESPAKPFEPAPPPPPGSPGDDDDDLMMPDFTELPTAPRVRVTRSMSGSQKSSAVKGAGTGNGGTALGGIAPAPAPIPPIGPEAGGLKTRRASSSSLISEDATPNKRSRSRSHSYTQDLLDNLE
eukprot:NODE_2630_length_1375_cov_65.047923_g2498_i0.p1 GENE.NODE_2630_length_1375_cov_65.047923_g2498_i0~~NODE_2630_length_1375_cov_65.047923_g2498_i0.p1  ORF type:complete len:408 (+),score=51.23 NODE_2630_length_1375_cov_65.047923_g2498_i0:59-1282(+)